MQPQHQLTLTRRLCDARKQAQIAWAVYKADRSGETLQDYLVQIRRCYQLELAMRKGGA